MKVVQIVVRSAPSQAVDHVERAFHEAGLETSLIKLGEDEDRNTGLLLAMCDNEAAHPTQAWLLPAAAVDLMVIDQDRAAAARRTIGLGFKKEFTKRVLITTDRAASEAPTGAITFSVADLKNGKIGADELRGYFA